MSDATVLIAELLSALATIPAVTVRADLAAIETTSAILPVLTVFSTGDRKASDQGYSALAYTRTLMVEAKITATNAYQSTLDALLTAIRTLIAPRVMQDSFTKALAIREQDVRFFHPAPDSKIAIVQITLEIDYLERF